MKLQNIKDKEKILKIPQKGGKKRKKIIQEIKNKNDLTLLRKKLNLKDKGMMPLKIQ